jgi:hypothetical protein
LRKGKETMAEEEQAELSHNASLFSLSLTDTHTHTHTITSSHSFLPRTNELKEKTYIYALKNERSAGLKGTE